MSEDKGNSMSFWTHIDVLRGTFVRILIVVLAATTAAFFLKEPLFNLIFAPREPDFVSYQLLERFSNWVTQGQGGLEPVKAVQLINTGLAQQFVFHFKTAFCAGVVTASPYIIYQLFSFIAPALYEQERKYAVRVAGMGYLMFVAGLLLNYFLIFPLTYRFLSNYQVSEEVVNMISLESYIDTLLLMSLMMGIVFEIPVISWILGKLGLLTSDFMRNYRRHAIIVILIAAAIITPTTDIFTLLIVSLPMWLLYEASIVLVAHTNKK